VQELTDIPLHTACHSVTDFRQKAVADTLKKMVLVFTFFGGQLAVVQMSIYSQKTLT